MSSLQNWINKITPQILFFAVLALSLVTRVIYVLIPSRPSWDGSVYLGMATYISSGGHVGLWEFFRPPVWPLILAPFATRTPALLAHAATVLIVAFSLLAIYLVYKTGESVGRYYGVVAAFLLSFSTPFFAYANTPMTEVISVLAVAAALYLFARGKYFWLGLALGIGFAARFPLGLMLPIVALARLVTAPPVSWKSLKKLVVDGVLIGVGFAIPAGIYFISNMYLYGDAFSAVTSASGMITGFLWLYKGDGLFYVTNIIKHNAWVIWILPGIYFMVRGFILEKESFKRFEGRAFIFSLFSIIGFLFYFSLQTHKEFRYIIPVMPPLAFLSGAGIVALWKYCSGKWKYIAVVLIAAILVFSALGASLFLGDAGEIRAYNIFYGALIHQHNATVISSTPIISPYSKVALIPAYNTWKDFGDVYEKERLNADYVSYDTCELHACTPGSEVLCKEQEDAVRGEIASREHVVFARSIGSCTVLIAHITK